MTQQEHIDALRTAHAAFVAAHEALRAAAQAYMEAVRAAAADGIRAPSVRTRDELYIPPLVVKRTTETELFREESGRVR